MAAANFERALALILMHEGGYVDHPADPAVRRTSASPSARCRAGSAGRRRRPRSSLTKATVASIYRKNYWDAVRGDELPAGVDYCVFRLRGELGQWAGSFIAATGDRRCGRRQDRSDHAGGGPREGCGPNGRADLCGPAGLPAASLDLAHLRQGVELACAGGAGRGTSDGFGGRAHGVGRGRAAVAARAAGVPAGPRNNSGSPTAAPAPTAAAPGFWASALARLRTAYPKKEV